MSCAAADSTCLTPAQRVQLYERLSLATDAYDSVGAAGSQSTERLGQACTQLLGALSPLQAELEPRARAKSRQCAAWSCSDGSWLPTQLVSRAANVTALAAPPHSSPQHAPTHQPSEWLPSTGALLWQSQRCASQALMQSLRKGLLQILYYLLPVASAPEALAAYAGTPGTICAAMPSTRSTADPTCALQRLSRLRRPAHALECALSHAATAPFSRQL